MSDKTEKIEKGQQPQSVPFRPITEGATPQGWTNIQGGGQPQQPTGSRLTGVKPSTEE